MIAPGRRAVLLLALIPIGGAVACSSAHTGNVSLGPHSITHDFASIRTLLNIHSADGGKTWTFLDGDTTCHVSAVLVNAQEVGNAVTAGARVATNADRTIGVGITGSHHSACVKDISRWIALVR